MRTYNTVEETIKEWSRILRLEVKGTQGETLKIWSKRLTDKYDRPFVIKETPTQTLEEWSKII